MTPDFDEMNRDELFLYVEALLKKNNVHSVTETWGETANRIEKDLPDLAATLRKAEERWDVLN